jgi:adenylate cyclase class 2
MDEIEIKFRVADENALRTNAQRLGFRETTKSTHEMNTLYDTADRTLRQKGMLLRLRMYGERCTITHKSHPQPSANADAERHKRRIELETTIDDCDVMANILAALDYCPCFTYEKFRAEWSDGEGQLVIDRTPLGTLAELEGEPEWIDRVAAELGVRREEYIIDSYGTLFLQWQQQTGSPAKNMTFEEMGVALPT